MLKDVPLLLVVVTVTSEILRWERSSVGKLLTAIDDKQGTESVSHLE